MCARMYFSRSNQCHHHQVTIEMCQYLDNNQGGHLKEAVTSIKQFIQTKDEKTVQNYKFKKNVLFDSTNVWRYAIACI